MQPAFAFRAFPVGIFCQSAAETHIAYWRIQASCYKPAAGTLLLASCSIDLVIFKAIVCN